MECESCVAGEVQTLPVEQALFFLRFSGERREAQGEHGVRVTRGRRGAKNSLQNRRYFFFCVFQVSGGKHKVSMECESCVAGEVQKLPVEQALFFLRFSGERREAQGEHGVRVTRGRRGAKNSLQNRRYFFAFFRRAEGSTR